MPQKNTLNRPKNAFLQLLCGPLRLHVVLFAVFAVAAFFLFAHPDVIETSNHAWQLLKSTANGRFLQFYNDVVARGTSLFYTNYAHYNVAVYLIFALVELPVFLVCSIFGLQVPATLLYFLGKLVAAAFFIGCLPLVHALLREAGRPEKDAGYAALFTALGPPAFFAVFMMGQYDSICLFFTLLGLYYWTKDRPVASALVFGAGAACKFFPLMLFAVLLLLRHKRVLDILKYLAVSLWLLAPTTLLFLGNNGDMSDFNGLMMQRLFAAEVPGAGGFALFGAFFAALCFAAYLWRPAEKDRLKAGLWLCLTVYALIFLFVEWHPQWVVLLAPFVVMTTFLEKDRAPWFYLDIAFAAGFFLYCATVFPGQLEANLLDFGLPGALGGLQMAALPGARVLQDYYGLVQVLTVVPAVLCPGALLCQLALKAPLSGGSPASRLAKGQTSPEEKYLPRFLWMVFGAGMAVWVLPVCFTALKSFGLL